jgi:drug/metabolite transporter (DMT)-like permease
MTRLLASLMLLMAALCWGAGNVANKTVLLHLGPITVVGLRCLIASTVLAPFILRKDLGRGDAPWLGSAVALALLFAAALLLQQIAFQSTTVTNASFLVNTAAILTPILAWITLGCRPGPWVSCAAGLSLVGAFLMAGASLTLADYNRGDLICLVSAAFYAAWVVALGQHAVTHGRPLPTALIQFAVGAAVALPLGLWTEAPTLPALRAAAPDLLFLGVVSTAFAFGLMTAAQRYVSASSAAVLTSAESLFGALGAYILLGERTPAVALTGAGLILLGIVLVARADAAPPPITPRIRTAPF